jgi:hypothetical protein
MTTPTDRETGAMEAGLFTDLSESSQAQVREAQVIAAPLVSSRKKTRNRNFIKAEAYQLGAAAA